MKRLILLVCGLLLLPAGLSLAQQAQPAPPATAPAVVAMRPSPRVEIFSFASISSQPAQNDWIGRGIQESLQSDVARTGATLLIPIHAPAPNADAVTVAKENKADLAVVGTYQISGDDLRVNGHLIDTATNTTVGGFAATGPQKNLFGIEDALGEQLRRLLPPPPTATALAQAPQQQQPPPTVYEQVTPPPTVNNYYDNTPYEPYYYPDAYDYDWYGYPYGFYGGIGIYGGGFYGRGFDRGVGRGFGGRPGVGGFHGGFGGGGFHGGFAGGHGGGFGGGHGGGHR